MHLSYLFYALGKPRFVNISVSYYAPELCLSGSLSQRVSGSNFLRRSFTLQFPVIPLSPWRPSRPCFLLILTISCLGLAGSAGPTLTKWRSDWQPRFSLLSLLVFTLSSAHFILTLLFFLLLPLYFLFF